MKPRVVIYPDCEFLERIDEACQRLRLSRSQLCIEALRYFLQGESRDAATKAEQRLTQLLTESHRDLTMLGEVFGYYLLDYFAYAPSSQDPRQRAIAGQTGKRLQALFVNKLRERLQRGESFWESIYNAKSQDSSDPVA